MKQRLPFDMADPFNQVLVVDDQPSMCRMIYDMLTQKGLTVRTANSYSKAVSLMSAYEFGVVISDICFDAEENAGIVLLERTQEIQPETPVILITGVPSVTTAAKAVRLNAYEYLTKPVSLHQLFESVTHALKYKALRAKRWKRELEDNKHLKDLEKLVDLRTANLVQSNQRFQLLFENSRDAIYMAARDGRILVINHAALELFDYAEHELVHLKCKDLYVHENQHDLFRQSIEKKGFVKDFEARMKKKSGSRIDCLVTAHVLMDKDDTILGVQGIIRDITEKKRAEEKIRLQNEFLVNVIESLAHPFLVIDSMDFRIKIANSAAIGKKSIDGISCHQLNHGCAQPCSVDEHRCVVREVVATRRPVTLEHFHMSGEAHEIKHEVHAFPLFDADGKVVQVIQYCIDITEKKGWKLSLKQPTSWIIWAIFFQASGMRSATPSIR